MSQIRKKSLRATTWIYIGFLIGAINQYFLTHKDWFSTGENGLTIALRDVGMLLCAFSTLGVTTYLYKFFPYYEDNTEPKKNDLLSVALVVALCGFVVTASLSFLFEPLIIRKFSANAILLVEYFYWTLPMAFFLLLYNILEAYSIGFQKGVLTSLLKETVLRLYTMLLILAKILNLISFHTFIILFTFQYAVIVLVLVVHLQLEGKLWLSFKISRVTKKYRKKIFSIMAFTFIVVIVNVLRGTIDGLVLAAKQNLGKVGIFAFAAYMISVLQAPLRSIIAVTLPILSRAWKEKDHREISKIYKRSSINLLSFALFVFFCIWLNFEDGLNFFNINPEYLEGKWVFFILGIVTIIEMGTGVNGQIIGTSSQWRFELWTSLLLTSIIIPLSYWLTVKYGILGPAIANLVSFSIYNFIRCWFLWKKYYLQPFSFKTLEVFLVAIASYTLIYYIFYNIHGMIGIISRTVGFSAMFLTLIYIRNISPDFKPVVNTVLKRLKLIN